MLGLREDDFNNFEFQLEILKRHKLPVIYFVLISDYGDLDKNTPFTSARFTSLIKTLADYADMGIHPSYQSNTEHYKIKVES